jgi:outer membrane protein OmpA-like peptidoglycan-associated protein/Mg-chelatase subunit ChlD
MLRTRSTLRFWIIISCLAIVANSCSLLRKKPEPGPKDTYTAFIPPKSIEPEISGDAKPPKGYKPVWFKGVKPIDSLKAANMGYLRVSRVEAKPDSIRLYAHVMDTAGFYYTGAAKDKKVWCEFVDTTVKDTTIIRKFNLTEASRDYQAPWCFYLVMDYSGSMGSYRARFVEESVQRLMRQKRDKDAFGIIKFDEDVAVECFPTTDTSLIEAGIKTNGIEHFGGLTAIGDAAKEGILKLRHAPHKYKKRAIILFSDGYDNYSAITKDSIIQLARHYKIPVCAVDFGDSTESGYLSDIAAQTGGTYHHIYQTIEFDYVFRDIYHRLMNQYVISFAPESVGFHKLYLKLCRPDTALEARINVDNQPVTEEEWAMVEERRIERLPPPPVPKPTVPAQPLPNLLVHFDFNKYDPMTRSSAQIGRAIEWMTTYSDIKVEIHGHTDFKGSDSTNQELSDARCRAIRRQLIDAGIAPARIQLSGFGEQQPVADNETYRGRARNRRAELVFRLPDVPAPVDKSQAHK